MAELVERLSSQQEIAGTSLPFTHVTTTVGETLTEIVCCTVSDLGAAALGEVPAHWDRPTFIRFLGGRVLFDSDGSLAEAAHAAVFARMLYSLHDILRDYFTVRGMAWPGDKEALTYWQDHEPALRAAWLAAVAATDMARKAAAWEALFPHVYAPLGGGPALGGDLIQPANGATVAQAKGTWNSLVCGPDERSHGKGWS